MHNFGQIYSKTSIKLEMFKKKYLKQFVNTTFLYLCLKQFYQQKTTTVSYFSYVFKVFRVFIKKMFITFFHFMNIKIPSLHFFNIIKIVKKRFY